MNEMKDIPRIKVLIAQSGEVDWSRRVLRRCNGDGIGRFWATSPYGARLNVKPFTDLVTGKLEVGIRRLRLTLPKMLSSVPQSI